MWKIISKALPQILEAGSKYTVLLTLISFFFGIILALFTALIRLTKNNGFFLVIKLFFRFYVWLFRSTPLLMQLFTGLIY